MAVEIQGKVGPQAVNASDGTLMDPYLGRQGQNLVQDYLPRYVEPGYRGFAFCGANQAGSAITNLIAAATGLILINPLGSGKNIWLTEILFAQTSVAAATANAALVLAANSNPLALASYTGLTALTIQPTLVGSQALSVARLCSVATLPAAPVAVRALWQPSVSATATTAIPPVVKDEVAGAIGIAPGCAISLSALSALSGVGSFTWIESPL